MKQQLAGIFPIHGDQLPALSSRGAGSSRLASLAAPVAVLLLVAAAAFLLAAYQARLGAGQQLLAGAARYWNAHGAGNMLRAGLFTALYAGWYHLRGAVIFAGFAVIEFALLGPPASWRESLFALLTRCLTVVLIIPLISRAGAAMNFQPLLLIHQSDLSFVPQSWAAVMLALAGLILIDLCLYAAHRAQHRFALLWRFHAVHHSIENIDSLNSNGHPFDYAAQMFCVIAAGMLVGFEGDVIIAIVAYTMIHDRLNHTSAPINLGPLNAVFVDNRVHRLHHSVHRDDHDSNFSSYFTLWDRVFGTYRRPHPSILPATGLANQRPVASLKEFFTGNLRPR